MKKFSYRKRGFPLLLPAILAQLSCSGSSLPDGQNAVETESAKIWVGKKANGFILPGIDGKAVDIGKNLGKRQIVLIFYRGGW